MYYLKCLLSPKLNASEIGFLINMTLLLQVLSIPKFYSLTSDIYKIVFKEVTALCSFRNSLTNGNQYHYFGHF